MHSAYNNYINTLFNNIVLALLLMWVTAQSLHAQDQTEIALANNYLQNGQNEKALALFQELVKQPANIPLIHTPYLELLLEMGKYKQAEEYIDRLNKRENNIAYRLDIGYVYYRSGDAARADKYWRQIIQQNIGDTYRARQMVDYFTAHALVDYGVDVYQQLRQKMNNPRMFVLELANLYRLQGKREEMVNEYLNYVTQTPSNLNYIKNLLQILLTKPEEYEALQRVLIERSQRSPESEVFLDLLVWVNLQEKNFSGAFIQARAYDRRFKKEQSKTLEIGQIALNNLDFTNAEKAFAFVAREYPAGDLHLQGQLGLIRTQEARLKRAYPINRDSVRLLIRSYRGFARQFDPLPAALEARQSQALLHGYYLDEKDSAVVKLQQVIAHTATPPLLKARCKMDLGDMYLLKDEPWEATLLYSQVEKSQRETTLGYEAKLKNAKLSYYKGDFRLAQEHLDILKEATTREIANDAMELSLRIKENSLTDTTGQALKLYSAIELLLYQNKKDQALQWLQQMVKKSKIQMSLDEAMSKNFWPPATLSQEQLQELKQRVEREAANVRAGKPADSVWVEITTDFFPLRDDLYWLESRVRAQLGQFAQAAALCQQVVDEFPDDVLADDAYFMLGEYYEIRLNDRAKAMDVYRDFLDRFPGSVYTAEARKRFRLLRGDFEEKKVN